MMERKKEKERERERKRMIERERMMERDREMVIISLFYHLVYLFAAHSTLGSVASHAHCCM